MEMPKDIGNIKKTGTNFVLTTDSELNNIKLFQ